MFFVAEAVLATKRLSASSHKGIIRLFGVHFVRTEVFHREMAKALSDAHDKRPIGDYGIGFIVTHAEAADILETAKEFGRKVKSYLERWTAQGNT